MIAVTGSGGNGALLSNCNETSLTFRSQMSLGIDDDTVPTMNAVGWTEKERFGWHSFMRVCTAAQRDLAF